MKTKIKFLFAAMCLAFFLTPKATFGQFACSYTVTNSTVSGCDIDVQVEWFDNGCSSCSTSMIQTIHSGIAQVFTCSGCSNICDVAVTLVKMGGVSVNATADNSNHGIGGTATGTSCAVDTYDIVWTTSHSDIQN